MHSSHQVEFFLLEQGVADDDDLAAQGFFDGFADALGFLKDRYYR